MVSPPNAIGRKQTSTSRVVHDTRNGSKLNTLLFPKSLFVCGTHCSLSMPITTVSVEWHECGVNNAISAGVDYFKKKIKH